MTMLLPTLPLYINNNKLSIVVDSVLLNYAIFFTVTEMKEDIVHSNAMLIRSDREYVRQWK